MMWGGDYWWGGFGGALGMLVMLAVVVLIGVGVYFLVRGLTSRPDSGATARLQGPPPPPADTGSKTALRILEERYARGEIDRDEFLQRRQDLLGG